MRYKSSLTSEIKGAIIVLFCFWIISIWYGYGHNSFKTLVVMSLWILGFSIVFVLAFLKGIYIVIENHSVKYVHLFVLRKSVEVEKISKIQKTRMGGFYKSLSLTYEDNGKTQDINILTVTFKKDTLKQFISDLKIQNSRINVDPSISELTSK